jgi:uncharacterized protein YgiM (DUF1202 family)
MKKKYGVILAAMLATGAIAQTTTNSAPPPLPAPSAGAAPMATPTAVTMPAPMPDESASTNTPPKKIAKKKKKAPARARKIEAAGAPFIKDETAVSKQNNVNVRAQSHINSEVVFRLQKGDAVTVINEVVLPHPKADEPSQWVQVALPASTPVWVSANFIDANQNVTPAKLNVRSGPGENYSVVGVLHKGDAVKAMHTKEGWTQIEAPTNAFGFVAAHLLDHKEMAPPVNVTMNTPPPTPEITSVAAGGGMTVTPATGAPGSGSTMPATNSGTGMGAAMTTPTPEPAPATEGPAPERVVSREGSVGDTVSIQAPTYFQLESLDDGKAIDYLYTTSPNLVLEHWRGKKVLVTGVESLDERWPSTPVLTIQKIQIITR